MSNATTIPPSVFQALTHVADLLNHVEVADDRQVISDVLRILQEQGYQAACGVQLGEGYLLQTQDGAVAEVPFSEQPADASPITQAGQRLGWLRITGDPSAATLLERTIASLLATMLTAQNALHKHADYEAILQGLHRITAVSATAESLVHILQTIYEETVTLMKVTGFTAALYDQRHNALTFPLRYDNGVQLPDVGIPFDPNNSVTAWMIANRRPILVRDLQKESFPVPMILFGEGLMPRSWLGVPMIAQGEVVGALSAQSYHPNAFNEQDQRLLTQIAQQAAVAILTNQSQAAYQQRLKELTIFNELSRELGSEVSQRSLPDLLEIIRRHVSALINTDHFYVAMVRPDRQHLSFPLVTEDGKRQQWPDRVMGPHLTENVIRRAEPVCLSGNIDEYAAQHGLVRRGKPSTTWMGVPIWVAGEVVGALVIQYFEEDVRYIEEDERILVAAAAQASSAIQISTMLAEEQRQRLEMAEANQRQAQLIDMIREISTPVIPVFEGVLVLPMMGTIDSQRATQIIDNLLSVVATQRAHVVLLDITGVPIVDTSVANYLLQAIRATQLLGAECVIVGIRPEVAQTIVGLGVDLGRVATLADLQAGVKYALEMRGMRVVGR